MNLNPCKIDSFRNYNYQYYNSLAKYYSMLVRILKEQGNMIKTIPIIEG